MSEGLAERIGIDLGRKLAIEDGIAWAAEHGIRYIDAQFDIEPNALESFDEARCAGVRDRLQEHGIHLGLHTLSAVNIAEISPYVRDAVDQYLRSYIELGTRLGAEWIVVHAGYHFTADRELRRQSAHERLQRAADYAGPKGQKLLLENMNWEPDLAEVHYLGHTIEECRDLFVSIASPALGWSFTVNHATLLPDGIDGFLKGMPVERMGEVRLADNNGEYELHMQPGTGIIDFGALLSKVEATGFKGHYTCAFGSLDDMLEGRAFILERAREAGVAGV